MKNYDILKKSCHAIFLVGSGNFWYEKEAIGDDTSLLYRLFSILMYSIYSTTYILEVGAALWGEFPDDEKRFSVTVAVCHTVVLMKMFSVLYNKNTIKRLHPKIIKLCEQYETESLTAEKVRLLKINVITYVLLIFSTLIFFVSEGILKWVNGSHFVTLVTYYPSHDNNSVMATICRLMATAISFGMMITMIVTVDSLTVVFLIMYKYKFITLRLYFENLRAEFDQLNDLGKSTEAAEKMNQGLINGIVMHGDLLRLFGDIVDAFGNVMSLQLCLTTVTAVSILLEITVPENFAVFAVLKNTGFATSLFILLGIFLCNAGEITHQAALVSDAIYNCGWHVCPPLHGRHHIRRLVVFSMMQAQQPLVMTAYKMVELTYATFLQTVKLTYSIFTLLYGNGWNGGESFQNDNRTMEPL